MTGAEIVIRILENHGVTTVFGYPGGSVLALYEALRKSAITHVLAASEAGAAHAADGYARAGGGVGVCLSTSGPGATNLVTGIATAFMDSSPVVFITGNVSRAQIGTDSFQEIDITGITLPVTKYNVMVTDVRRLAEELRLAFRIAAEGRPGPVLVDIPRDIQEAAWEPAPEELLPEPPRPSLPDEAQLQRAAALIDRARHPLLLVGGGAKNAQMQALALMQKLRCPAVSTVMGIGVIPADTPGYLGTAGIHGTRQAASALKKSDLVIAAGTRFSDRIVRPGEDRLSVLHLEVDRSEVDKNVLAKDRVIGDAARSLEALCELVKEREGPALPPAVRRRPGNRAERGIALASEIYADAIVATDVGQHQVWTAQFWPFSAPCRFLTPGGLGTMGFGMGAAVGAALATGERVMLVTGDGSFLMDAPELATAARLSLPVTVLLLRNRTLGMVRQQQLGYAEGQVSATGLDGPADYTALARSLGAAAFRARGIVTLERALRTAHEIQGPAFIAYEIGTEETVREVRI